ncbi:hypothetical protein CTA2_10247 [Colletotrichum tanaceti]|uniref:Uncharacterized protein n=1 Tax=Colletotrichum tanaceti TaxID=1306861 RepID=A0A4U6X3F2_9PEZI|nr:hypothetical protein CTA2_10247 [Colletotrichum tanaceti]TKW49534.1 hypothetical protein CTA1_4007 [Colletotrichum tanaceti]
MASQNDKINRDPESVRRILWPAVHPMTKIDEKNRQHEEPANEFQQHQTGASASVGDGRHDVFLSDSKETNREMKPVNSFQRQGHVGSGLTDEERRDAFLADLYEGPYANMGQPIDDPYESPYSHMSRPVPAQLHEGPYAMDRPIIMPVSRLGRAAVPGAKARLNAGSFEKGYPSGGFRDSSAGVLGEAATPGGNDGVSTPIHIGALPAGEAPRHNKAIRIEKDENNGMDIDPKEIGPATGNVLLFESSSKNLLTPDMQRKTVIGAQTNSAVDTDENETQRAFSTPSPPPPGLHWNEGPYGATPDRPRTVKTAPAAMFAYDDMEMSPTIRRQMQRLRITPGTASHPSRATGADIFGRPSGHPQGPRPYLPGMRVPQTPTKGKRARCEFENTNTLSGKDVAREREILARYIAAAKDEDKNMMDDEEDSEMVGNHDEEDDEDTPKASVLNCRMAIDEEAGRSPRAMNFPTSSVDDFAFIPNASPDAQSQQQQQQNHHPQQQAHFSSRHLQQQQQQLLQLHQQQHPRPPPPSPPPASSATAQSFAAQQAFAHAQYQQLALMNGMNGGNAPNGMGGMPTPAGQQAELNYIYGMVEELSRQLAENRRVTEDIVSGLGRVRSRARTQGMSNDDLIHNAADDIRAQERNLDNFISILSESLEKAKYSRDANATLLTQYATVLAAMLKQFHEYKAKHVTDVAAWHRSYRSQLAEARAENSRLREQIWEMQERAGKANEALRKFRRKYDENETRWDRRVEEVAARQELRFWKRMAMPEVGDDDPCWSDDDDLIDSAEKERLKELEKRVAQEQLAGSQQMGEEYSRPQSPESSMMGGVPMQRDLGIPMPMPVPPPRPSSATSSTGSSGQ